MIRNRYAMFVFLAILVLVLSACELPFTITMKDQPNAVEAPGEPQDQPVQQPQDQPVEQPQAPAVNLPPTPTPFVYSGPMPAAGTGGVFGRLLWNNAPVSNIQVKLCDEIKYFGGCEGAEYPATTDAYGVYAILNVPPGTYGLTYKALDSDTWYYVTSGILNAKDFEIAADQMVDVGDHLTVRTDLVITSPAEDERLSGIARPTLKWEPYPEAAYYELTFHGGRMGSIIHRMKLTETSFTLDRDLQTCDYSFDIEAFNASETVIAEYDGWRNFEIGGLPTSCILKLVSPADGASAAANAITLTWEPHAWAGNYKLMMFTKDNRDNKILDFVETSGTSYLVTQAVTAGTYEWYVYAYDEFGDSLGFSDTFTLVVTAP